MFSQAEVIKADLDKVLDYRGAPADDEDEDVGVEPRTAQPDIKYAWTQAEPPRWRTWTERARVWSFSGLTSRTS